MSSLSMALRISELAKIKKDYILCELNLTEVQCFLCNLPN